MSEDRILYRAVELNGFVGALTKSQMQQSLSLFFSLCYASLAQWFYGWGRKMLPLYKFQNALRMLTVKPQLFSCSEISGLS